jgi:hypothetical protein
MDFIDELKHFAARAASLKDALTTEEATKNALILPFFQLLGYDIFNPLEFVPEFTADVGVKKGEKVDYAIILNGKPALLIEAKWCGEALDKHDSQLFRYFGTTTARFGILTNGIVYKFYTDLDEPNKMDLTPFLELDLMNINESVVPDIRRFAKEKIDLDAAFTAASELKYTNLIKALFARQRTTMDDNFINYVLGEVYTGRRMASIVEKFTPIIKKAYNSYLNDIINDTLKSAMLSHDDSASAQATTVPAEDDKSDPDSNADTSVKIVTTQDELEAYYIIKSILYGVLPSARVGYKDTGTYFGVNCDNLPTKWICRLKFGKSKKFISMPAQGEKDTKYQISNLDDLFLYRDQIISSASRLSLNRIKNKEPVAY